MSTLIQIDRFTGEPLPYASESASTFLQSIGRRIAGVFGRGVTDSAIDRVNRQIRHSNVLYLRARRQGQWEKATSLYVKADGLRRRRDNLLFYRNRIKNWQ